MAGRQRLNDAALQRVGRKTWNKRLEKALRRLPMLVRYDRLYLGGGNAKKIRLPGLPNTTIVANEAGIRGGLVLWHGRDAR